MIALLVALQPVVAACLTYQEVRQNVLANLEKKRDYAELSPSEQAEIDTMIESADQQLNNKIDFFAKQWILNKLEKIAEISEEQRELNAEELYTMYTQAVLQDTLEEQASRLYNQILELKRVKYVVGAYEINTLFRELASYDDLTSVPRELIQQVNDLYNAYEGKDTSKLNRIEKVEELRYSKTLRPGPELEKAIADAKALYVFENQVGNY